MQHLIVPVDGSDASWRAFDVALAMASRCGSSIRVVEVAADPVDGRHTHERLQAELQPRGPFDVEVSVEVRLTVGSVAGELETLVSHQRGAIVVMASHGKGRSAAIVGSVTEDLLRRTFGPIVLVGPKVVLGNLSGPVIVTVDGSNESEAALPLAAAWAIELKTNPLIVTVATPASTSSKPGPPDGDDMVGSAYLARLAAGLQSFSGRPVEFDELHGRHPERAVVDYATRHDAALIVASSHGRSGLSRLTMGSVCSGFVRTATCPVVVTRLPNLDPVHAERPERMWSY